MGAVTKSATLPGKLTEQQVRAEFNNLWEEARSYSGNDPYNGDWNTIDELKIRGYSHFATFDEAENALCDTVEKGTAVAVRVKLIDESKSKRLATNALKIRELSNIHWREGAKMTTRQKASLDKKIDALHAKRKEMIAAMAEKSKTEVWYIFGWACS